MQVDSVSDPFAAIVAIATVASSSALSAAEQLGTDLADKLFNAGGGEILMAAKRQTAEEIRKQKAAKVAAATTGGELATQS